MSQDSKRKHAERPEDLGRFFIERANAGDADGLAALYEPDAVLATPQRQEATGTRAIRQFYEQLLAARPAFSGEQQPALIHGDLALTSTRFSGGVTVEVARRQPDGTWLWIIDQPNILG